MFMNNENYAMYDLYNTNNQNMIIEDNNKKLENIDYFRKYIIARERVINEKFELVQFMSSGSVGTVYEGRYKANNKKVCLKFLIREEKYRPDTKEIDIHKSLKHKNIINLYDYIPFNYSFSSCIEMEFAKFGDLRNFQRKIIKKKYFPETILCFFAKQVIDAIKVCHEQKIIHLDIKPQNVLIDGELNAKITDFSSAFEYKNIHDSDQIRLPFAGTSLYMSPEVLINGIINIKDCEKVDLFSLGVSLYKLAYGEFPYNVKYEDNKDPNVLYNKINFETLEFPKYVKVSEMFKKFLRKLLKKRIKERISIKEALEDKWIKGYDLIKDEKEKTYFLNIFLINILTNNILCFNKYINSKASMHS